MSATGSWNLNVCIGSIGLNNEMNTQDSAPKLYDFKVSKEVGPPIWRLAQWHLICKSATHSTWSQLERIRDRIRSSMPLTCDKRWQYGKTMSQQSYRMIKGHFNMSKVISSRMIDSIDKQENTQSLGLRNFGCDYHFKGTRQ